MAAELSAPVAAPYRIPVLLGLGANLGDPEAQLAEAVRRIRDFVDPVAVSGVYRTEPVGILDQPEFANVALAGTTDLTVYDLHERLQAIEAELGRIRTERNAPRLIDIDLLAYGELAIRSAHLTVPHPRLHERSFVLVPLAEVAPEWRHPLLGSTPAELLARLESPSRVRAAGALRL